MKIKFILAACLFVLPFQHAAAHGSFRKLSANEITHFRKVEAMFKALPPKQVGALKLIDTGGEFDAKSAMLDEKHAQDKGVYTQWYAFEYGKYLDDIKSSSGLEDKISQASGTPKEQALREQLAQLVANQRLHVEIGVNHGMLNFNFMKGQVETLAVPGVVAYRARYMEDPSNDVPYVTGTVLGIGPFGAPRTVPYDGNPGGVFEVAARDARGAPDFTIQSILVRIYGAPALADQFLKQLDMNALRGMIGKRIL